jgi:uncharacterized protein YbaR (Trm112 family)
MRFREELLELLVCPISKKPLIYDAHQQQLISPSQGVYYPIVDGIAVLLIDEARPLSHGQHEDFFTQSGEGHEGCDHGGFDH